MILEIWNAWFDKQISGSNLRKVPGVGPIWNFFRLLSKTTIGIKRDGQMTLCSRTFSIFQEDQQWFWTFNLGYHEAVAASYTQRNGHLQTQSIDWVRTRKILNCFHPDEKSWSLNIDWLCNHPLTSGKMERISSWSWCAPLSILWRNGYLAHRFQSCSLTKALRDQYPQFLGWSSGKITTG